MKTTIIITENVILDEQEITALLKEYDYPEAGIVEVAPGIKFGTVEGLKVGYNLILIKDTEDSDYHAIAYRRDIEGMAVNDRPIVIRGNEFKRIGCVQTQDELDEQTKTINDDLADRIEQLKADAQAKIDKLNAEYAAYQNNEYPYIEESNDTEDRDTDEDVEEEDEE